MGETPRTSVSLAGSGPPGTTSAVPLPTLMTHDRTHREIQVARLAHATSVLCVFGVGILGAGWVTRSLDGMDRPYLLFLPAYVAVVLAHEFGHAVAGLWSDFRVTFLYLGPLRVEWPRGRRMKVELNRRLSLWGGAVVVLPRRHPRPEELDTFQKRMVAVFAAGPAVSVAAGAIALGASLLASPPLPNEPGGGLSWLQLLALMSMVVGLAQAIPIRIGDQRSDGLRVLRLLWGRPGTHRALLEAMVVANADGVRPRDWPLPALAGSHAIGDLATRVLIYYALLDRGRRTEAWDMLEVPVKLRNGKSEKTWRLVRDLERTYMRTVYLEDGTPDLPEADIPLRHPHISTLSLVRARTARMMAEGDVRGARQCADAVRRWRSVARTSGLTQFNLTEIDKVLASAGDPDR